MIVSEFENRIFEIEEVRLIVRAPAGAEVEDYDFQRCAADGATVTEWLKQRVHPRVGEFEVTLIDGTGVSPHGRTKMMTLRQTYEH